MTYLIVIMSRKLLEVLNIIREFRKLDFTILDTNTLQEQAQRK